MLKNLINYIPPIDTITNPQPELFEGNQRVKLILTIKQLLGWENEPKDENGLPTYDALNQLARQILPPGLPEMNAPVEYLLDNFQIPQNIWDKFNDDKA